RDVFVDGWVNTNSFWSWETGFDVWSPFVDDRELEDGTPIERQAYWQWFGYLSTDSRKPVQVQFYWTEGRSFPRFERVNQLGGTVDRPGRPTIKLDQLVPLPPDQYVDANERQIGLNFNLILRWEWRTGSTLYLVYAHQSSNDLTSGVPRGLDYKGELSALSATGVAHGDTLLVKVDLLSAL